MIRPGLKGTNKILLSQLPCMLSLPTEMLYCLVHMTVSMDLVGAIAEGGYLHLEVYALILD